MDAAAGRLGAPTDAPILAPSVAVAKLVGRVHKSAGLVHKNDISVPLIKVGLGVMKGLRSDEGMVLSPDSAARTVIE
jgi:hypothetical protein